MTGNPIGSKGGLYFAQALQINDTLEFIDLGECDQVSRVIYMYIYI